MSLDTVEENNNDKEKDSQLLRFLNLDVSGVKFKLLHEILFQYPDSLLAELAKAERNHVIADYVLPKGIVFTDKPVREFHVSKSPKLFDDIVLQYYITGKLHVPEFMCKDTVQHELKFWKLATNSICTCWGEPQKNDETDSKYEENSKKFSTNDNKATVETSKYSLIKAKIWKICDFQTNSKLGMTFSVISVAFILISILDLVLSTIPDLAYCIDVDNSTAHISISDVEDYDISDFLGVETTTNFTASNVTDDNGTSSVNSTKTFLQKQHKEETWSYFSDCLGTKIFEIIDLICIVWFTVEFLLRLFSCPDKAKFMKSPLNLIDVLATFPYYIEVLVYLVAVDAKYLHPGSILVFRLSRSITVLRILKLARYFEDLRILGQTLQAARQELFMLFLFVLVSLLIFATTIYQLEKDQPDTQFTSIPAACWWGIATLTTVGYGDMTPSSVAGKCAGCIACITGIMIMAFPVSVLVEHFTNAYKKKKAAVVQLQLNSATTANNDRGKIDQVADRQEKIVVIKSKSFLPKHVKRLMTKVGRRKRK